MPPKRRKTGSKQKKTSKGRSRGRGNAGSGVDEALYTVDRVIGRQFTENGCVEYYLSWAGYDESYNCYVTPDQIVDKELMHEYNRQHPDPRISTPPPRPSPPNPLPPPLPYNSIRTVAGSDSESESDTQDTPERSEQSSSKQSKNFKDLSDKKLATNSVSESDDNFNSDKNKTILKTSTNNVEPFSGESQENLSVECKDEPKNVEPKPHHSKTKKSKKKSRSKSRTPK